MKIKALKIIFVPMGEFFAQSRSLMKAVLEEGKSYVQPKSIQYWDSIDGFQKYLSPQKLAILAAIYQHKPESVYQLAKILGRAQQNVARDCDSLEKYDFIKFVVSKTGRKSKAPRLIFEYDSILICLPNTPYKIGLSEAA